MRQWKIFMIKPQRIILGNTVCGSHQFEDESLTTAVIYITFRKK